ncbi:MAG: translation initiation factor IF-1 [Candidatus Magasanikbacteria bacterium]
MSEENKITKEGQVSQTLPNLRFKVKLDEEEEDREILAHLSGKMNKYHIRVVPGDRVRVELPKENSERGRIVRRL